MSKETYVNRIVVEHQNITRILKRALDDELAFTEEELRDKLREKAEGDVQNGSVDIVNRTNSLEATVTAIRNICT